MLLENITSAKDAFKYWLKNQILSQKLNNPLGFLLLTTVGLVLGSLIPYMGIGISTALILGVVMLPVIVACMFYHQFGIGFTLVVAFLVNFISRISRGIIRRIVALVKNSSDESTSLGFEHTATTTSIPGTIP